MKYYIDTEFHEGTTSGFFSHPKQFVDIISIGIVAEDGRNYYAICSDFDVKAAWNSWQPAPEAARVEHPNYKEYWLRKNVLYPIYEEVLKKEYNWEKHPGIMDDITRGTYISKYGSLREFKQLIKKHGTSKKTIAEEVRRFCTWRSPAFLIEPRNQGFLEKPYFYAYYADYDWVALCSLYGKMMNLPNEFPKYCYDLKQDMDRIALEHINNGRTLEEKLTYMKRMHRFPRQEREHNALDDAKWNRELHHFLGMI